MPHELPFSEFISNLGPGQRVSRQALGLPCLGEVKLNLSLDKKKLCIEIFEAKNLKQKTGYRVIPGIINLLNKDNNLNRIFMTIYLFLASVYIKLYLFNGTNCLEKQKTSSKRRTLNPSFQETLRFEANYRGTILQLTIWGDYGKLDRKVFMGVAQIVLDELNLDKTVGGWYKLYSVSSIISELSVLTSTAELSKTESGYSIAS